LDTDPAGPPETPPVTPGTQTRASRTGRNLPVAIGVGALLGGLVLLTLLTIKATFLIYVGVALGIALTELAGGLAKRDIKIPVLPVAAGGLAVGACMYWLGYGWALAALGLTVLGIFAWRLPGGATGYVKDVTAGIFALIYLPVLAWSPCWHRPTARAG